MIMTGKSRGDVDGDNPVYVFKRVGGVIKTSVRMSATLEWVVMQMGGGMLVLLILIKSGLVNAS